MMMMMMMMMNDIGIDKKQQRYLIKKLERFFRMKTKIIK